MLANQLITSHYPTTEPDDKVLRALQLMEDFDILHIPVVEQNKYLGIISKDDLLDVEENAPVKAAMSSMLTKAVKSDEFFLAALKMATQNGLTMVPVIDNQHDWFGAITCSDLLRTLSKFTGAEEPGAVIVLEMEYKSYSFGEISRLVETNDAYITQFNTTTESETGLLIVTLKINKTEISDILATFQRYEYSIRYFIGEEQYENELRFNYDHLMSYLKV